MQNAKNGYILAGTEAFTRGELDNVALAENAVCLEQTAGRYVLYGCYTSPVIAFPPFTELAMSWNAETPQGTVVEAQARVLVDGAWSGWMSFGKWSPYLSRASACQPPAAPAYLQGDTVHIPQGRAIQAQLRIYLYTDDERQTPSVRLLAASVRPAEWSQEPAAPYGRLLRLPAYSQQVRDPALRQGMSAAAALASLVNRWGQDALPEELAHAMFDHGGPGCHNHAFAAALAGAYGYEAYLAYLDPAAVWNHVKLGESVALAVHYAATPEDAQATGLPLLPGAFANGENQLMALRGFELAGDTAFALVNDSLAPSDREAEHRYKADDLWKAYSGRALLVRGRHKEQGAGSPGRRHAALRPLPQVGAYMFQAQGGEDQPLPAGFAGTIACAVQDGTAHATTAHKHFCYVQAAADGGVHLPPELLGESKKITVYAIWPSGCTLVGEVNTSG